MLPRADDVKPAWEERTHLVNTSHCVPLRPIRQCMDDLMISGMISKSHTQAGKEPQGQSGSERRVICQSGEDAATCTVHTSFVMTATLNFDDNHSYDKPTVSPIQFNTHMQFFAWPSSIYCVLSAMFEFKIKGIFIFF